MSAAAWFVGALLLAVLNFFAGAVLGRQWLLEELEDERRDMRLAHRRVIEERLAAEQAERDDDEEVGV